MTYCALDYPTKPFNGIHPYTIQTLSYIWLTKLGMVSRIVIMLGSLRLLWERSRTEILGHSCKCCMSSTVCNLLWAICRVCRTFRQAVRREQYNERKGKSSLHRGFSGASRKLHCQNNCFYWIVGNFFLNLLFCYMRFLATPPKLLSSPQEKQLFVFRMVVVFNWFQTSQLQVTLKQELVFQISPNVHKW